MASVRITDGKPRKSVHFSNDTGVEPLTSNQQQDESSGTASDDSDETIRSDSSSPLADAKSTQSLPDADAANPSQSTQWTSDELLYMPRTSSSSTPLLYQQSLSPLAPVPENEILSTHGERLNGYSTMTMSSIRRRGLQKAHDILSGYLGHVGTQQLIQPQWQSSWGWLRGASISTQSVDWLESATNEETQHSFKSIGSFLMRWSKRMIKRTQESGSEIHKMCTSERTREFFIALGCVVGCFMALAGIGYRVPKLIQ